MKYSTSTGVKMPKYVSCTDESCNFINMIMNICVYLQGSDSVFAEEVMLSDNEAVNVPAAAAAGLSKSGHYEKRPGQLSPGTQKSLSVSYDANAQFQVLTYHSCSICSGSF